MEFSTYNTECTDCQGQGFYLDTDFEEILCHTCNGAGEIEAVRYCATCGEREGSDYAKHCCTDDNMLEA